MLAASFYFEGERSRVLLLLRASLATRRGTRDPSAAMSRDLGEEQQLVTQSSPTYLSLIIRVIDPDARL